MDVHAKIEENIGMLNNAERGVRKKALEVLTRCFLEEKTCLGEELLCRMAKEVASKLLDPQETCRESSANLLARIVDNSDDVNALTVYLVPSVTQRLMGDAEPSEEIRFLLVSLLKSIIVKSKADCLENYLRGIMDTLAVTITDRYPEVKKESCSCVCELANCLPKRIHMYSERLAVPLSRALLHQHSKVRVGAIEAIGKTFVYDDKSFGIIWPSVAQRLLDSSPSVRAGVVKIAGHWMLQCPDHRSSYPQLISLLLTGMSDDVAEIRQSSVDIWQAAGKQFENEKELRDRLEYEQVPLEDYPGDSARFCLGCRVLSSHNLTGLLPAVFNDLKDWQDPVRLKAAQLLYRLLLNAEDGMIQHVPVIIDRIIEGCKVEESGIVKELVKSLELVGYFVPSHVWLPIILAKLDDNSSVVNVKTLAALLRGSRDPDLSIRTREIADTLVKAVDHHTDLPIFHAQVLACIEEILKLKDMPAEVHFLCFKTLLTILAFSQELHQQVNIDFDLLAKHVGVDSKGHLFAFFAKEVLDDLFRDEPRTSWNVQTTQFLIFKTLLMEADSKLVVALDDILPALVELAKANGDLQLKFYVFQMISHFYTNLTACGSGSDEFVLMCIQDCVLPNLQWHAGKTASVIRVAAITCLIVLLQGIAVNTDKIGMLLNNIVMKMFACLEDDNHKTRNSACQVLDLLVSKHRDSFSTDEFQNLSLKLMERLEDVDNGVRLKACRALDGCLKAWMKIERFDGRTHGSRLGPICREMLVYMDDPEDDVRQAVLDTLIHVANLEPNIVENEVCRLREKGFNVNNINQLIHCIENVKLGCIPVTCNPDENISLQYPYWLKRKEATSLEYKWRCKGCFIPHFYISF